MIFLEFECFFFSKNECCENGPNFNLLRHIKQITVRYRKIPKTVFQHFIRQEREVIIPVTKDLNVCLKQVIVWYR